MGKKAVEKKQYILEQAEKIFADKGFKKVTMNDIVEACRVSRGGVYLYFSDTTQIFEAVLQQRAKTEKELPAEQIKGGCTAKEQMRQFLYCQMKELLNPSDSLIIATYEYLFAQSARLNKAELKDKYQNAMIQLEHLIQDGVAAGEFFVDPSVAAHNIVLLLEGFRISSTVLAFEEQFLEKQMEYILSQLVGGQHQ